MLTIYHRNVNGIRNPFSYPPWNTARTFSAMFDILESDIVVMQELKIQRKDLRDDMVLVDGWDCFFSLPKHKKGYSGVGIYTRNATCAPIRAEEGLLGVLPSAAGTPYRDLPETESIGGYLSPTQIAELADICEDDPAGLDAEGRSVIVEFPAFVLFGVYSPANTNGQRDGFRYGFICALDFRIRNLIKAGKQVVLVGDLNVSRHENDSGPTLEEIRKGQATREGFLSGPNRRIFNHLLLEGEVLGQRDEGREKGVLWDTTRAFHPDRKGMYTCWDTKTNARPGNFGARIDFVLVCEAMKSWISDANIQEGLLGSDHCPVYADFHDQVSTEAGEIHLQDIMNPSGHVVKGVRKQEWRIASSPAFSAKRLPEFDKRRSIKSMFAAPPMKKSQSCAVDPMDTAANTGSDTSDPKAGSDKPLQTTSSIASPVKRKASISTPVVKDVPLKRQKSDAKTATGKGQQSLKGFFRAQLSPAKARTQNVKTEDNEDWDGADLQVAISASREIHRQLGVGESKNESTSALNPPATPASKDSQAESPEPSPTQFASQIASAEENQRSWGALFAKPKAPMCGEHDEPCKSMQTKKKGSNQGRSFWMCARPLGPSGDKERGTQWRCPTFIWCSDWQGGRVTTSKSNTGDSPVK